MEDNNKELQQAKIAYENIIDFIGKERLCDSLKDGSINYNKLDTFFPEYSLNQTFYAFAKVCFDNGLAQGAAIIHDRDEGPCMVYYRCHEERDYKLDVKDGKLYDGRTIIDSLWFDNPTDFKVVDKAVTDRFDNAVKDFYRKRGSW